jgi:uncharacterized membrane protein
MQLEAEMSDDQGTPSEVDEVVAIEADDTGATVVAAVGDETGVQAVGKLVTDYENAVLVAAFADDDAAYAAYQSLQAAEDSGRLGIEGVLVVKTNDKGEVKIQKMTDHSTKTGVKWGAVGGLLVGIFFPPAVIASTVGVGVVGGVLGKVRNEWHKSEVGDALYGALGPDQSGILALVKAGDVQGVKQEMPQATKVRTAGVDETTAENIKTAAKQAS